MLSVLSVLSKLPHIHIHITPVFFTVEPLSMRWHTILLVAGVLAGTWAAVRLAHRHGQSLDTDARARAAQSTRSAGLRSHAAGVAHRERCGTPSRHQSVVRGPAP